MENRSFDHFLGWLPNANGIQEGLSFADTLGNTFPTYQLTDYQGCGRATLTILTSAAGCSTMVAMRWVSPTAPPGDTFPIGYYKQSDLAFLGQAAPGWTTFNSYFAAIMAETFPNRIYQHAGQTDRLANSTAISTLPTIWAAWRTTVSAAATTSATYLCWHCGAQNICPLVRRLRTSLPIVRPGPYPTCRLSSHASSGSRRAFPVTITRSLTSAMGKHS